MNWKRTLFYTVCVAIAIYVVLAVTVLNRHADDDVVCGDVRISIEKGVVEGFLTPDEVKRMLTVDRINPIGQTFANINLRTIEEKLTSKELIEKAECYKSQDGHICINVKERVPVIRVMAQNGDNYYVAGDGNPMQNTGYTCNLVVATGHISRSYAKDVLAPLGRLLLADDFWRDQIVQVNVLPDSTVEMVPRVGEHIIYVGRPVGMKKKLERLQKFYRYGLSQAGWNKYSRISVEFDNQIICKKVKNQ